MVDDGSNGSFGKEIEFRANLEKELRNGFSDFYYEKERNKSELKRRDSIYMPMQDGEIEEKYDENIEKKENNVSANKVPLVLIVG